MSRKNKDQAFDYSISILRFKWEFLRRNQDYRRSFEELWRKHGTLLRRVGYPLFAYQHSIFDVRDAPNEFFPHSHRTTWWGTDGRSGLQPIIAGRCAEWDVSFMKDPDQTASLAQLRRAWGDDLCDRAGRVSCNGSLLLNPFWYRLGPSPVIGPHEIEGRVNPLFPVENPRTISKYPGYLILGLHVHANKKEIMERVGQWFDAEVEQRASADRSRTQLELYEKYISAWKLIHHKSLSARQAARRRGDWAQDRIKERAWEKDFRRFQDGGLSTKDAEVQADRIYGLSAGKREDRITVARLKYHAERAAQMIANGWRDLSAPNLIWTGPQTRSNPS